jgi:hypothetical protein
MTARRRIEHAAPKRGFLTLDQVAAFAQDAMRSGATGSEVVAATVSIGGKLQKLSIEVEATSTNQTAKDATP